MVWSSVGPRQGPWNTLPQGFVLVFCVFKNQRKNLYNYLFPDPSMKESAKAAAPAFSFAGKYQQKVMSFSPSPNTYNTAGLTARGAEVPYLLRHPFSFGKVTL